MNEVVTSIYSVKILEERLVNQYEVLIHFQKVGFVFFKYHLKQSFVVDVVWRLNLFLASFQVVNPLLDPLLVNQVQHISILLDLFELVVGL